MVSQWHEKAKSFTKLGRLNVALHCWDRAIQEDPSDAEAWAAKGVTLEKLGKHMEAIDCYTEATDLNPFFALAWYNKGAVLGNLGKYREALGCFMEAKRQGHPKAEDAIESCETALGEDPWVRKAPAVKNPLKNPLKETTKKKRRRFW